MKASLGDEHVSKDVQGARVLARWASRRSVPGSGTGWCAGHVEHICMVRDHIMGSMSPETQCRGGVL